MACRAVLAALVFLSAAHAAPAPQLPAAAGTGGSLPLPDDGCQRKCGGVDIPFPFGTTGPCMLREGFLITCREDKKNGVSRPFLLNSNVEVLNISLSSSQVRVLNNISYYCYNRLSRKMVPSEWRWNLTGTPYTFSDTANKFTVVGCRTLAYIGDSKNDAATYKTGCVAMCRLPLDNLTALAALANANGTCSGIGCCQTAIPSGLQYYQVWFDPRLNASVRQISGSPCSYAVLMESSNFTFSPEYVTPSSELYDKLVPVVLDWTIRRDGCDGSCVSNNSRCITAPGGRGHICNCIEGFEGNPYLRGQGGCQDIDECKSDNRTKYPCFGDCNNIDGNYTCSCPVGTRGNPWVAACQKDPFTPGAQVAFGIFGVVLVALVAILATEVFRKKRSNKRQGYFEQHGGKMLLRILNAEGIQFTFFDSGDIMKATNNFRKANIVGEGAHGAVYKGMVSLRGTSTTVAVKRCKQIDEDRKEEFAQELAILCRINHPNIVKLLGCCLHFEAPMLVYEFEPNKTLNDLLHGKPRRCVTLATRLRIAAEAAEALAHLHAEPHTTLHGDVKPENILLGKDWVAKVSDFGCSTLGDNVQVVPKGFLPYLDPEFLKHPKIAKKTDVYSFGVVLMEILTGKMPLAKEQKHLTIIFQEAMENDTLHGLLDADITVEEGAMSVIQRAAEIARRCTAVPGTTRPGMDQVAKELRRLSNEIPEGPKMLQALEDFGYINAADESETSGMTGFYSVGTIPALSTELAR